MLLLSAAYLSSHCVKLTVFVVSYVLVGFPGGSEGKVSACNAGDLGSIPRSGRSPGEGNGNPLQYACLENDTKTFPLADMKTFPLAELKVGTCCRDIDPSTWNWFLTRLGMCRY